MTVGAVGTERRRGHGVPGIALPHPLLYPEMVQLAAPGVRSDPQAHSLGPRAPRSAPPHRPRGAVAPLGETTFA